MSDIPYRAPSTREPDEPEPDPRGPWVLQTWVSRRSCPSCQVQLFAARQEGFRIDACGACGGAWLDHETARRAVADRNLVPALLADQASSHASLPPAEPRRRIRPECAQPLVETRVPDAGVLIDTCAAHGAWFDPHEMRAVIEAVVRRTPPVVGPEVDRRIALEEQLGRFRPPEPRLRYDPSDFYEAISELVSDIARDFRRKDPKK